ncbi:MAG: lectin [Gemmatimonadota bacterium]|nr:lectin [Gemmatimonadota bacterium]
MNRSIWAGIIVAGALGFVLVPTRGSTGAAAAPQEAQEQPELGFFITSVGPGDGANLGGLEGADAHCQMLAEAAGAGHREWRAYLSAQATDGEPAVHARDRIGEGPWHNAEGLRIAADVDDLHYNNAAIDYEHALDEKGERIASGAMGDPVTHHDILTGTRMDGTAFPPGEDRACSNWTSASEDGSAMVGHHDRFSFSTPGSSWNSAHPSRGCSQANLEATGGAGFFYCFAAR